MNQASLAIQGPKETKVMLLSPFQDPQAPKVILGSQASQVSQGKKETKATVEVMVAQALMV